MTSESFDKLTESVERIERAIVGDKVMGHRGLVDRVEHIERKLMAHEKQLWKWIGGLSLLVVILPILIKLLIG